jgi:4-amino-4-deoxychorismate lyase
MAALQAAKAMQHWVSVASTASLPSASALPSVSIPLLSGEACLARLRHHKNPHKILAMFSSAFRSADGADVGAITTDAAAMVVQLDDHMVHRGHAVFDTANVANGCVYGLDFHLDRLRKSASHCRIDEGAVKWPKDRLRSVILQMVAASGKRDGVFVRYWLTAGTGSLGVSPSGVVGGAQFYAVVEDYDPSAKAAMGGVSEVTIPPFVVPLKPPMLATSKTTNYLLNALVTMAAEERGGFLGIQLHADGVTVAEQSVANIAVVDASGAMKVPPFDSILHGTTVSRAIELVSAALEEGAAVGGGVPAELRSVEISEVAVEDLYDACEIFSFGGGGIVPIVEIDGRTVGNGAVGPVYNFLQQQLYGDIAGGGAEEEEQFHDVVPYMQYEK